MHVDVNGLKPELHIYIYTEDLLIKPITNKVGKWKSPPHEDINGFFMSSWEKWSSTKAYQGNNMKEENTTKRKHFNSVPDGNDANEFNEPPIFQYWILIQIRWLIFKSVTIYFIGWS